MEIFEKLGYKKYKCKKCGHEFYSQVERDTCGDAPCDKYDFIGNPATDKPYNLYEIQKVFREFFENEGHTAIARYPVLAKRWRDDVFLVGASIFCFQPWNTSGLVKPPANPLEIEQPSIRLNDVDNVGRTGRHMTCFTMGSHTVINTPDNFIYWVDRCIELCDKFFESIGINTKEITYIPSWWEGGGNEGPCYEVMCRGVELSTLVFMQYRTLPDGGREEIPIKVVDTGYGLERIAWISQGTATAYDSCFSPVIEKLKNITNVELNEEILAESARIAGLMDIENYADLRMLRQKVADKLNISIEELLASSEPMEAIYIIADHTRCLAFMLADGIIPSNVKEGYLARLILRRTIRYMKQLNMSESLADVMNIQLDFLKDFYSVISDSQEHIMNIINIEEKRYGATIEKGKKTVKKIIKKLKKEGKNEMPLESLIDLYDAQGMPPETVKELAGDDFKVDIPDNFFTIVADSHEKEDMKIKEIYELDYPETISLFYKDFFKNEFEAKLLGVEIIKDNINLIFDQSIFYPEGGGQPADGGKVTIKGKDYFIEEVSKINNIILHQVKSDDDNLYDKLKSFIGEDVKGQILWDKRISYARHHTATHLVIAAARKILGDHIWQAGSQNGVKRSRIDLSHYKRITQEELDAIEKLANSYVMDNIALDINWFTLDEALKTYGLILFQGGLVPGNEIRVVKIPGVDVQACAGTHVPKTGDIGMIKIHKTERVQDGVERIEYSAGLAAVDAIQEENNILRQSSDTFKVPSEQLPKTCERFFTEWKQYKNEINKLKEEIASLKINTLSSNIVDVKGLKVLKELIDGDIKDLQNIATDFTDNNKADVVIIGNNEGKIVLASSQHAIDEGVEVNNIIRDAASILGGGGGGRPSLAQGAGPNTDKMNEALDKAFSLIDN